MVNKEKPEKDDLVASPLHVFSQSEARNFLM